MPRHNQGPYLTDEPNEFGLYEIRWTENGRSKRKSTGERDYRRAQRVYAEFILALDQVAASPAGGPVTMAQVFDAYLADRNDVMSKQEQEITFGYLRAHFGHLVVQEVDKDDVDAYVAARGKGLLSWTDDTGAVRGGRKAKPSTCRRELTMLGTAVEHCIRKKVFKAPDGSSRLRAQDKPVIDLPPAPKPRDRWMTREEAPRLLAACQPPEEKRLTRVYRYAAVMLYAAARSESVYRLDWSRIQLQKNPARLAEGDYGLINFQARGRRVTRKRRGWVPIGAELYPILLRAEQERVSEWFLDKPACPYQAFKAAAKRAGLPDVSPHTCRHTWATWAAQDGVSLFEIAGVLHDTVATVEKHYAHHQPAHLRRAVNRPMLITGGDDARAA